MQVIGITGGIGSGKSTISEMLREEGYPVFDCDKKAKFLCDIDPYVMKDIDDTFGPGMYINNILQRKKLAEIVFNDKEQLKKLNAIVHPKTREYMYDFILNHMREEICFIESAIMFDSGLNELMDRVLCVYAPEDVRIDRVVKRNNTTKEEVLNRINNQLNEKERLSRSDYVIHNDRLLDEVKENLLRLVESILGDV